MSTEIILPAESDYPAEAFRADLSPEKRAGCAWAYFRTNALVRGLFRRRVEMTFGLLPDRMWDRSLDSGTGAGYLLPHLSKISREVDGVDLSSVINFAQAMLDKRGVKNVRLQQADVLHLPFENNSFDLLICLSVIEHIPDPAVAYAEMARVLRPGGVAIVGYPLEHPVLLMFENLMRWEKRLVHFIRREKKVVRNNYLQHVSRFGSIESGLESIFDVEKRENMRLLGIPLYRILRLKKLGE